MVNVVTNPGELDKVPIKVVPIYIEPVTEEYVDPEPPVAEPEPIVEAPRSRLLGRIALLLGVLTVLAHIVAIPVASANAWTTGTVLAWAAIGLSILAVGTGIAAVITGHGRRAGIAAIVVGLVGNPYLLLSLLRVLSGAQS